MIALAGPGRRFHLAQQRVHFFRREPAAGAHGIVTGDGRQHVIEPALRALQASVFRKRVGDVGDELSRIDLAELGRRFAHQHGAGAEGLDRKAELLEIGRGVGDARGACFVEFDDLRHEQSLPRDSMLCALTLQPLVDQPLMRGVLIDDHHAVAGLRDNIGLVHLGARGAERRADLLLGGRLDMRARVRRRRGAADAERGLLRLSEACRRRGRAAPVPIRAQLRRPLPCPALHGREQIAEKNRVMSDLLAMALACDLTRVFFHMYTQPVNNTLFGMAPAGHHQLTHDEPGAQPEVQAILRLILTDLAYFLNALRGITEGDGTLLDHSLVLCTTDCSYGRTHSLDEYPLVLAGGASGAMRRGVHLRAQGENASRVMLSVLQAMGVPAAEYGVGAGRVTDGLSGLLP